MLNKTTSTFRIITFSLGFSFLYACQNHSGNIAFPIEETEFSQPVNKPFKFGEAQKIQWESANPDSIKPVHQTRFDFNTLPSKPVNIGNFKPSLTPPDETKFDWNKLPDTTFDISRLQENPLQIKTYLLPKPKIIKTNLPKAKEGPSLGLLTFGLNEGLPSMKIDDLLKDSKGMIWFICAGNLFRYTGDFIEQHTLVDNPVLTRIVEDDSGFLWLGADNTIGLYVIDLTAGIQRQITLGYKVLDIVKDQNGIYWLGTIYGDVFMIDWVKKTQRNFRRFKENIWQNSVWDILEDRQHRIWLCGANGVSIINASRNKIQFLSDKQGLVNAEPWSINEDNSGRIWIGSGVKDLSVGTYIVYPDSGIIRHLGKKQGIYRKAYHIEQDNEQNIYLTADSVLFVLNKKLQIIKKIITNERYLDYWRGFIIRDNKGQIWMGTRSGGLIIYDTKGLSPQHLDKSRGMSGNAMAGLAEDQKGQIWIGGIAESVLSTNGWINVIDAAHEKIYDLTNTMERPGNFNVIRFWLDSQGRIWAGTMGDGIYIYDQKNKLLTHIGKEQGMIDLNVYAILGNRQGLVWLATGNGFTLFDPGTGKIKYCSKFQNASQTEVSCFLEDAQKQLWIGTWTDGIYLIDAAADTMKHFGTAEGLASNVVNSLTEDWSGRVWVGTEKGVALIDKKNNSYSLITALEGLPDASIRTIQMVSKSMYVFTGNGLSVFTESQLSSQRAIGTTWQVRSFDTYQGLLTDIYNTHVNSSLLTKSGQLFYSIDLKALMIVNEPKQDTIVSPVYITGIEISNKWQNFLDHRMVGTGLTKGETLRNENNDSFYLQGKLPADTGYLQKNSIRWDSVSGPFHLPVNLQLPYLQNYISFHFANTDYRNRDKIRYRYILIGSDKQWSDISDQAYSEVYRGLSPGNYIFKVCSRSFDGLWSSPSEFAFTIMPPWYRTWWAVTIYALAFLITLWNFIKWREGALKKEKILLEEKIIIRTHELQEEKQKVEIALNELKSTQVQLIQSEKMASLGELTAGIAHEIQNPLNFVNNFSELNTELIEELQKESKKEIRDLQNEYDLLNDIKENGKKINHHGQRADAIVKGMLQHSRVSNGQKEPTEVNKLVDEYLRLSYHGLRAKDKSFNAIMKTDFDESIGKINMISQDIGRVLLNLFNNAFYAVNEKKQAGNIHYEAIVSVATKKFDNKVLITVKDNGNGIPEKAIGKIFQPFFTTKPTGQGTGLGLSLAYDIVKSHGGELKVATQEGEFTVFEILLPLTV